MSSRRGHNEGTIVQRSDGRWAAVVNLGTGPDGKRKRKSFYGKTRKEVAEKLKIALRDQQLGLPIAPERQTVKQFLTRWLTESAKPTLRPTTFATYSIHVRVHIVPALGHIPLQQLSPQDVQAFINHKLEPGLSPRSVSDIYAVLRRALNQAVKWSLVPRNVATIVDTPRVPRKQMRCLTPEQARKLLVTVQGDRLEALYSVAIALGLRRGEALALKWEDVDLDLGILHIKAGLVRIEGKLQRVEPKTAMSRRTIRLPWVANVALRAHKERQSEDREIAGARWNEMGLVFPSQVGTHLEPRSFKRNLDRALQKAGLEHIRIHDLRHTAASLMLAQGVSPKMVSEILGHSRVGITFDTYVHIYDAMRQEAADMMDLVLKGAAIDAAIAEAVA